MKSVRFIAAAVAALSMVAGSALAAKPAAAPAPQAQANGQPQGPKISDTKEVGDWTVRCYAMSSPSPCEMIEMRVAKKTGQRILSVLFAYVPSRDQHIMQIAVPLGVALQNGLVLSSDTYTSPPLHFRRCDQLGCYVEIPIDNQTVSSLGRATKAEMQVVSMDGRKFNLVFSLTGFTAAHADLVELAKQKAVTPPAQPQTAPDAPAGNP
jgi:invasion protein IalB